MSYPLFWTPEKLSQLKTLYDSGLSMREVGLHFDKSVWAVNSIMKRHKLHCRKRNETRKIQFLNSETSFNVRSNLSAREAKLKIAGLMLYWAEGAKRNTNCVDFANSDPMMITLFIQFLRQIYRIKESKLRIYLYAYQSLPTNKLITYWSSLTQIPQSQFTKPYIRPKSNLIHDKMQHGLIHIRYGDIRLLNLIMDEIKQVANCWGTQVDNEVRL